VRDHNVQVNSISPGFAYTHMTDEILHAGEERAGRREIESNGRPFRHGPSPARARGRAIRCRTELARNSPR